MTADDVRERVARALDALEPARSAAFHEWVVSDSDDGPPEKPTTLDRADAALAALAGPEVVAAVAEVLAGEFPVDLMRTTRNHSEGYYLTASSADQLARAVVEWITGRAG